MFCESVDDVNFFKIASSFYNSEELITNTSKAAPISSCYSIASNLNFDLMKVEEALTGTLKIGLILVEMSR